MLRGFDTKKNFRVAPTLKSGRYKALKESYKKNTEIGILISLFLIIILFQLSKKFQKTYTIPESSEPVVYLNIEQVPITKQGMPRPEPPRPVVPIPSEDPTIPEDLTIEETELDFSQPLQDFPQGDGFFAIIPPRPIADVFPEYPESEKKKGLEGEIELSLLVDQSGIVQNVQVVRNTTDSKICEEAAIQAAYQTQFIPAKKNEKFVSTWIHKTYKFGLN